MTTIRHESPPPPEGCRWCGMPRADHAIRWVDSRKWHNWEAPTAAQLLARMRAARGLAVPR